MVTDANPKWRSLRYSCVAPDLPPFEDYKAFIEEAHKANWFTNFGPLATRFEREVNVLFSGVGEGAITCHNATSGLTAALIASQSQGTVLVPAFTFPASLSAIKAAGLRALIADVTSDDWIVSVDSIRSAITKYDIGAVMLVSPFGFQQDFSEQIELCMDHGIAVVIDSAAGFGLPRGRYRPRPNLFEVYSLHATKPFGIGEGGIIFASDEQLNDVKSALNFGLPVAPNNGVAGPMPTWGINGKMSEIMAAIALAQLKRFPAQLISRSQCALAWRDLLSQFDGITLPDPSWVCTWQLFPILMPTARHAEAFVVEAEEVGVEIRRYYRPSLNLLSPGKGKGQCRVSEDLAERMCCLPIRASQTVEEQNKMQSIVIEALVKSGKLG